MKAIALSAAAAVLGLAAPVSASIFSYGNSLAAACYDASLYHQVTKFNLEECNRAIDEEVLNKEDRIATFVNRGIVKMNLGMHPSAERDYDLAISMDANQAEAWLNKGLLRLRQDRPADAIPLIERAMELKTRKPALAAFARGMAHEKMGKFRAAYADYVRARDLDPDWALPVRELARYQVR
jgi:tetratricopeptide (TPR) repeat protein